MLKGALMGGLIGGPMPKSVPKAITIRARDPSDIPVPTMLAATGRPVEWAGQVRFGNHLGGLINRMGGRAARNHAPTEEPVQQPDANVARTPEATPHQN
ncbi:hypothetical protein SAMN05444678_107178 [Sphingomonas sp. YR710]|uniref:hypothetical protein n=1 Tax=Sphingomonas sp. YR710 TaxID=1882773 RepID=UPI0008878EBC|nr:hypothetical protein [Sphingomonas sp. YR710]SDC97758.1 hypothetical protein SAMN05444678_107178 [Sphingomonas sp. YR710]